MPEQRTDYDPNADQELTPLYMDKSLGESDKAPEGIPRYEYPLGDETRTKLLDKAAELIEGKKVDVTGVPTVEIGEDAIKVNLSDYARGKLLKAVGIDGSDQRTEVESDYVKGGLMVVKYAHTTPGGETFREVAVYGTTPDGDAGNLAFTQISLK